MESCWHHFGTLWAESTGSGFSSLELSSLGNGSSWPGAIFWFIFGLNNFKKIKNETYVPLFIFPPGWDYPRLICQVMALKMGASLLSFCPRLVMNDHHQKDGIWFRDKEPIDFVSKTEANDASRFSGGDLFITFRPFS